MWGAPLLTAIVWKATELLLFQVRHVWRISSEYDIEVGVPPVAEAPVLKTIRVEKQKSSSCEEPRNPNRVESHGVEVYDMKSPTCGSSSSSDCDSVESQRAPTLPSPTRVENQFGI